MFKAVEEDITNKEISSLISKYLICNLCKFSKKTINLYKMWLFSMFLLITII